MIIFISYPCVFLDITCLVVFTILQSSVGLKCVEFLLVLLFLLLLRSAAAVEP